MLRVWWHQGLYIYGYWCGGTRGCPENRDQMIPVQPGARVGVRPGARVGVRPGAELGVGLEGGGDLEFRLEMWLKYSI